LPWQPGVTARALTTEEVEELVNAFGTAARLVQRAGVDAIELHCHEGYLFDQFMTPLWNRGLISTAGHAPGADDHASGGN